MITYIDEASYMSRLGNTLKNLKNKGGYTWNFRCPKCGDSKKNKYKSRGYCYKKENNLIIYCHNCGYHSDFKTFLKSIDKELYNKFIFNHYATPGTKSYTQSYDKPKPKFSDITDNINHYGIAIDKLPQTHHAVKLIEHRRIPRTNWSDIYYTDKFKALVNSFSPKYIEPIKNEEERIVLPFRDETGSAFGISGRSFDPDNEYRYLIIKVNNDIESIFGLQNIDAHQKIYVVEGQFDSLFINNCVAICSNGISRNSLLHKYKNIIYVPDNEPRNKDVINSMKSALNNNIHVVIWPKLRNLNYKDINEMAMAGVDFLNIIDNNVYSGIKGLEKLVEYKHV